MIKKPSKKLQRQKRHQRIRNRISGSDLRPRLSVFRSHHHIYAQLIDDTAGKTICASSTLDKEISAKLGKKGVNKAAATIVGEEIAKKALVLGIKDVVFDRGGYIYHGRIQALADAARENGLNF